MDCVGEQTTNENRLGRAGGLGARRGSCLCPPAISPLGLPILARSAALLSLLLQDGTVDLELTSTVIALDPGMAFGTLLAANLERNGNGEIWQFPLAVVAAGCGRLQAMLNGAFKVESSYDCSTSAKFRRLYLRGVQRACIAEWLAAQLRNADPRQSYVAGLLCGLPRAASHAGAGPLDGVAAKESGWSLSALLIAAGNPSCGLAEFVPAVVSVWLADGLLKFSDCEVTESSAQVKELAASPHWRSEEAFSTGERCRLLAQAARLGRWVAANAPRLSPWDFMARLHRHRSWE